MVLVIVAERLISIWCLEVKSLEGPVLVSCRGLPGWWAVLLPLKLWWVCTKPGEPVGADLRDGMKDSYSLFIHIQCFIWRLQCYKDRLSCMWKQCWNKSHEIHSHPVIRRSSRRSLVELVSGAYRVVIAKWCYTAAACLLGQQWERRQQQGYQVLRSQDGSPQLSAGPASRGRLPPCSLRFAEMCT